MELTQKHMDYLNGVRLHNGGIHRLTRDDEIEAFKFLYDNEYITCPDWRGNTIFGERITEKGLNALGISIVHEPFVTISEALEKANATANSQIIDFVYSLFTRQGDLDGGLC